MKSLALFLGTLFLCLAAAVQPARANPYYLEKPSLKKMSEGLSQKDQITDLYNDFLQGQLDSQKVSLLWSKNNKLMKLFYQQAKESKAFVRGEIEEEKVLNSIVQAVQLSILMAHKQLKEKDYLGAQDHFNGWLLFAADLPFEEATLVGLRVCGVIRSLLLDALEKAEKDQLFEVVDQKKWSAFQKWSLEMRSPWPVDRVVLSESRRVLGPKYMPTAEKVAVSLQKNTYQTSEFALANAVGRKGINMDFIKQIWREKDIEQMKTEVFRINAFQIRMAARSYEAVSGQKPKTIDQLVSEKFLPRVLINYRTGKPFSLEQAALH